MKDTLETNLPEETGNLEESKIQQPIKETTGNEVEAEQADSVETSEAPVKQTKEGIIEQLEQLVEAPIETTSRTDVEALKQNYYKIRRAEIEEMKKEFLANGGEEKDFIIPIDETEERLKQLLSSYKEKKAIAVAEDEKEKATNYAIKLQLIDQLKALTESQDDFNKRYNAFKEIQQKWKETRNIPQEHVNTLWKTYQMYSEQFYDIIKINNQFRDYDFKKNLELKTALCETVEKLETEPDPVSAFHQLQKLHQQWREIGPVAKELREDLWNRFKTASTIINKRHQEHFEQLKQKEEENLAAKTAICEQIEAIDYDALKSFKDWDKKSKEVIALQEKWKTIGFTPKKYNIKIFERFRTDCDLFFEKKGTYYKVLKSEMEANLEKKKALCEKAEALKDSTDWKETTEKMIALQKEWKTIGAVTRKYSDSIWKRFITACDYFFDQKNKMNSSQKSVELSNLADKKELINKIKNLDPNLEYDEALETLHEYIAEWNKIGFVPFKDKDKIYKAYHEAVNKQFDRLNVSRNDRRLQSFRENINEMTSGGYSKGRLFSERDKLMRTYEKMKNELQTYENNIGFLNISSKGGNGLLKELERKIEQLKEDMALIVKKIETIDQNLD